MKKINYGWVVIILLSITPVIIWSFSGKISASFFNFQNIITSLGEIFGLVGLLIFSINFILATRLPFIDKLFNGLNNVYKKHGLLGQLSFILLLFHPLFLLPRYATNFKEGASFLLLGNIWSRNFGIIALWIMALLIITTLYLRPRYDLWKITHKIFGLALFFGALHAYFIPGYVMRNILLKSYVLFFVGLGMVAFLYRSIFSKFLVKKTKYIVENISRINQQVIEITMKPVKNNLDFLPGQFVFVSFKSNGLSESHPFSISSAPNEETLKLTIKNLGDYTKKIATKLNKGVMAEIEGPFGSFSYKRSNKKDQVWIAGGIGITPFLSFAKDIDDSYRVSLIYSIRNKNEAVHLGLLRRLEQINDNLSVIPFYSEQKGHIDGEYLFSNIENLLNKEVFICGPPVMISELRKDLIKLGLDNNNIHSEEFSF